MKHAESEIDIDIDIDLTFGRLPFRSEGHQSAKPDDQHSRATSLQAPFVIVSTRTVVNAHLDLTI
jgi:hypothetical protein